MTQLEMLFEECLMDISSATVDWTRTHYRMSMQAFFRFMGDKKPEEVRLRDVSNFILEISRENKGSSVIKKRAMILRFWTWMLDHGHLQTNPLALRKLPRLICVPADKKAFTYEMHLKMLEQAEKFEYYQWKETLIIAWN